MLRRNRLYTVNRFNRGMFNPIQEKLFPNGGALLAADRLASAQFGANYGDAGNTLSDYMNSTNAFGISKADNPFSKMNLKGGLGAMVNTPIGGALVSGLAGVAGSFAGNAISGGLESDAGSAISNVGSTVGSAVGSVNPVLGAAINFGSQVIGGLTNRAFGIKENAALKQEVESGIAQNQNFTSNAGNFDTIQGPQAVTTNTNVYKGGWFSGSKARRKNEELNQRMIAARDWANRSVENNIFNLVSDQTNDALANYAAYGGPLYFGGGALGLMQQNKYFDTIDRKTTAKADKNQPMQTGYTEGAKTFDNGGLMHDFMQNFSDDPIGAVVRYNKRLEDLAAEEEEKEIEAQRAAEYADMQKRLLNLETENQGLQAMMAAMPTTNTPSEIPASSSTPSPATKESSTQRRGSGNRTWDYIKRQLRGSGRFNDVQIEGIKYNLQRESSLDPTVVGDGGAAFGLGQWHGSRQPKDRSLEGQTQHLINTLSKFDGVQHWINKKDYEGFLNARTPEEAHYYIAKGYERPKASIVAKVKRDRDMSLKNLNAFGGELGTNGTDFTNGLLYIDEGGSHESNPLDGVPMGLDPEGIPNLVEEGETVYNDYVFSDRMQVPDFMLKDLGLPKSKKGISFADASKKLAQESEKRPNDPISKDGLQASLSRLAEIQETERMKHQAEKYMGLEEYACGGKMKNKYDGVDSNRPYGNALRRAKKNPMPELDTTLPSFTETANNMGYDTNPQDTDLPEYEILVLNPKTGKPVVKGVDDYEGLGDPKTYATWMRYAPAVGSGVMALTDALGWTNKPDYTYADKIAAAAEKAEYAPNVSYNPIGNYLTYRPMDIWFEQNRMDANARAIDRAIMNNAAPIGTKMAGLLASGYNNQIANGQLYRQALEYNDAMRERVADFNRRTNMFNSQMGLEAAMANARYQQAARQMGLSGLAQAAALRNDIDARIGAARSANLSNFLTSLGNIGRENFAMNQLNWDKSRNYTTDGSGRSRYKRQKKSDN